MFDDKPLPHEVAAYIYHALEEYRKILEFSLEQIMESGELTRIKLIRLRKQAAFRLLNKITRQKDE